jgi:uncharacterized protein (TIGR03000 family)
MPPKKPTFHVLTLFSGLVLFGVAEPVSAQLMSKWGHPVVTFGSTPYDSINTGHGNYPGGPGFIPGYGYYPGPEPGHYPWLDGPGVPFDRRKLAPTFPGGNALALPHEEGPLSPGTALLIVKVPEEAEIWVDDAKTTQDGSYRRFVTPALPEGRARSYTIRARWLIQDAELTRVEEVRVQPGGRYVVNFLTPDSWTGRRLPTLPPPRKVSLSAR